MCAGDASIVRSCAVSAMHRSAGDEGRIVICVAYYNNAHSTVVVDLAYMHGARSTT